MNTQTTPTPQEVAPALQSVPAPLPASSALQTQIAYSLGMFSKSLNGLLTYDNNGVVQLVDATTNSVVFSKNIQELGKVTRAEYAIYVTIPGMKKVCLIFGGPKRYITENALSMPFGVPGVLFGLFRSNKLNKASELESWVELFKAQGKINNFSPNFAVVVGVVIGILIVVVSFLTSMS